MRDQPSRHDLVAAAVCLLLVTSPLAAAPELVPDPTFRFNSGDLVQPLFTPYVDDAESTPADSVAGYGGFERRGVGSALVVRRLGPAGVRFGSPPLLATTGHAYLLSIGWDPRFGRAEAALIAHGPAGEIISGASLRLLLLEDGRAYVGPLHLGPAAGPFVFGVVRGALQALEVTNDDDRLSTTVRVDPLPPQVAYLDLQLGHGPESPRAVFWLASLVDLSEGTVAVRARGLDPSVIAAPDGVLLDPDHAPNIVATVDALQLDASPGERVALSLLLPRSDGTTSLDTHDLMRVDDGDDLSRLARGARIEGHRIALQRTFAPTTSRLDVVWGGDTTTSAPTTGRLEVEVPDGTPGGLYSGTLELRSRGGARRKLQLQVRVHAAPTTGNLVSEPGFELHDDGIPLGWELTGLGYGPVPTAPESRSGARALHLTHAADDATTQTATSLPCVPTRTARHRFALSFRVDGAPAAFTIALTNVGDIHIAPSGSPPQIEYVVAHAAGIQDVELRREPGGWSRLDAVADLSAIIATHVLITSRPNPELERSVLLVDDLSLTPLLTGLEEISRFERLTANPGFEAERLGAPRQPVDWQVAATQAGADDSLVPHGDLVVDTPRFGGQRAVTLAGLGAGTELRSRVFRVGRGDRLVLALRARPTAPDSEMTAVLRLFDDKRRALRDDTGVTLTASATDLDVELLGEAAVRIDPAIRGFHTVEARILNVPPDAAYACLALRGSADVDRSSFVIDDARVAPVRAPFVATGVDLDGFARNYDVRLWDDDTTPAFLPVFEQLASLGLKPDVPTPESFVDYERPFPSVAPAMTSPIAAAHYADWAYWWWRRGFPVGNLAPAGDEDDERTLRERFALWLAPLREDGLATLAWAPTPMSRPCSDNPHDLLRLDRWASTLVDVAPDLHRHGQPCTTFDVRDRERLAGHLTTWVVTPFDLASEPPLAHALLELSERGDALWADIGPWLARLDDAPAAPRAAVWRAWHLGFDGVVVAGLTRWKEAGFGRGVDGSLVVDDPAVAAAPGVLLWPAERRRLEPSRRLLQLARGLRDVALLRRLEELAGEANGYTLDVDDTELESALVVATRALRVAHGVASQLPRRIGAAELEHARTVVIIALAELDVVVRRQRSERQ